MVMLCITLLNIYFEPFLLKAHLYCMSTVTTDALLILHICFGYVQLHVLYIAPIVLKRLHSVIIVFILQNLYVTVKCFCVLVDIRISGYKGCSLSFYKSTLFLSSSPAALISTRAVLPLYTAI